MKVFVAGSTGFIGRNVSTAFEAQGYEVFRSSRVPNQTNITVNLLDSDQVKDTIARTQPDIIINCAGVVGGSGNFEDNVIISRNLLEAVGNTGLELYRFVICGSAGEYGHVDKHDWPVSEDTPLRATNPYALSKIEEERIVHDLAKEYGIDAVVVRIFNPLGSDMPAKFLITNVLEQIKKVKAGESDTILVGRADALRDYVYIDDVSRALFLLATKNHKFDVYNVGSGVATSTEELVNCMLGESGVNATIVENSPEPEETVASQADISRLEEEFSWKPSKSLKQIIKEIIHNESPVK